MALAQNASTIALLKPMSDQLAALGPEERASFRLPEGKLGPVQFRCARVGLVAGRRMVGKAWGSRE